MEPLNLEAPPRIDPVDGDLRGQVDRILMSDCFRHSEGLRRLLNYLVDKSFSHEGDHLKEYSIGVDVFAKPKDYDPRLDSSVRLQVSRLRQKLADYYASEGLHEEVLVVLPKGRFRISCERRVTEAAPQHEAPAIHPSIMAPLEPPEVRSRRLELFLAVALIFAIAWGSISTAYAVRRGKQVAVADPEWTEAAQMFWGPFVRTDRPLVVTSGIPFFVALRGCCIVRRADGGGLEETVQDPKFEAIRRALNNPDVLPVREFTLVGQTQSALLLGKMLGNRAPKILFARSTDLSWQQLAGSNTIIIGNASVSKLLTSLPTTQEMTLESSGLRVLHPESGERSFYPGRWAHSADVGFGSPGDDGDGFAVISVLPGPNGTGYVASFAGHRSAEYLAAVSYATDPALVQDLIAHLKNGTGRIPTYFQAALNVSFRGGVPTSSRFLLKRELHIEKSMPQSGESENINRATQATK